MVREKRPSKGQESTRGKQGNGLEVEERHVETWVWRENSKCESTEALVYSRSSKRLNRVGKGGQSGTRQNRQACSYNMGGFVSQV